AAAAIAKPGGTGRPSAARAPREAALPPTCPAGGRASRGKTQESATAGGSVAAMGGESCLGAGPSLYTPLGRMTTGRGGDYWACVKPSFDFCWRAPDRDASGEHHG